MEDCRLKNPGAREIAQDSLRALLSHQDFLDARRADGSLTSEEGAVANAIQRNTLKWLQAMGVDSLRDLDDCPECNGTTKDARGKPCKACDGTGAAG